MTRREQVAGIIMPHNCLRHSFASYHLAKYQDAARLSLDMGHTSPKLLFNTYREVVYPEAAQLYFAIVPPTQPAHCGLDGASGASINRRLYSPL
jgi:integrase